MKRPSTPTLCFLFVLLLLNSCSQSSASTPIPSPRVTAQAGSPTALSQGWIYTDAKLGFQLTLPRTWQAQPQPGSQASLDTAAVTFTVDEQSSHALILVGVFHGSTMPVAFAKRGTPTTHVGPYPAFVADRSFGQGRAPCLVRLFLAHDDYVLADWCAPTAFASRAQFEQVLATYQPASSGFVSRKASQSPHTCAGMQEQLGYTHALWGRQLATPTEARWRQLGFGTFICSNEGSADWYLFQCTELVNRLLYERWALPHLPGNAARYYDYYQDGVLQPGTIRTFPAGSYQLSDEASQGKSAFRPVAGDLLIFQDVKNPQVGWTSGLTNSPGHVAVIVGVDSAFVYIAQENYSDTQYFLALPIHKIATGYAITDLSGWSQRIVRGWIHFTVNGGLLPTQ
jgi:hypothetical protein